ncbi:MAG: divalent-cation tolerance protein CutA [Burkholderiales bacterium]|nr:divalent-cation tolerance protein CutA [Burkholderiales bacterium]
MEQVLLVITNLPDMQSAQALARKLVEQKLTACVNCLPPIRSIYQWQGTVEEADEVTLLMKTTQLRYAELEKAIQSAHPYQVPEIIAIPVTAGLPAYLQWIADETRKDGHEV